MNKEELFSTLHKQNIFWSYDIKTINDISDPVLIEHTLLYADVAEIKALFAIFSKEEIRKVWEERIVPDMRYMRLNYYLARIFFGIENTKHYLKDKAVQNSRYEKLRQLSSKY